MSETVRVTVAKEFGLRGWTLRVDGVFIADFYREVSALRMAMRLRDLLRHATPPEGTKT